MKRIAVLALAMTACTPTPPPPAVSEAPEPAAPTTACNATPIEALLGQRYTPIVQADAQRRSGARTVRVIRPGMAVTMDYRPDRLNIQLDEAGNVAQLRCY